MDTTFWLILALTAWSVWLFFTRVCKGGKRPSILAWLIIAITTAISLGSFLDNLEIVNGASVAKGVLFVANTGASLVIFLRLLFVGRFNLSLTRFDKVSAGVALAIGLYWYLANDPFGANLATQALMIISYILILERVVKTRGESDDLWFWASAVLMSLLSIVSVQGGEVLETVNTWRSVVSTGAVLSLIWYFHFVRAKNVE